MGRHRRIELAGACYYLELRGNNGQDLFLSSQDRRQFLSLLKQAKERHGLSVYAYCLTANQVLLLLETSKPNLSTVMQGFNTAYTKYFNAQHDGRGHLFEGRYRALVVEKERYLSAMTRYIHLYPARAGIKESPWRYPWSSGAAYVQSDQKETIVDSERVLSLFAKTRLKQSVRYLQFLKDRMRSLSELVIPVNRGLAIASDEFVAKLLEQAKSPVAPERGSIAQARRILAEIAERHGVDEDRLVGPLQWREISGARHQAIHRIWKEARLGVTELGRLFNRTPGSISQVIKAREQERSTSKA